LNDSHYYPTVVDVPAPGYIETSTSHHINVMLIPHFDTYN